MFKVLLVDDEPNVRQGIKMMIPWDEINCEVVAEADDGDDGLNKIMTVDPDIVIADIKMPGKTGIEMTESAKALGFKGKFLILSGYSDFSYAKDAIALGVENFILKPVDEDELIEAIKAAGEKITKERERRYKQDAGSEYLNEKLVKGLFAGNSEAVGTVLGQYNYRGYLAAVVCCLGNDNKDEIYSLVKSFFSALNNVDSVHLDISGVLGVLFKGWEMSEIRSAFERVYNSSGKKLFICLGDYVDSPEKIAASYSAAEGIYHNRFLYSHIGIAGPQDIRTPVIGSSDDLTKNIYAYMEINDTDKIRETLDRFFESMLSAGNTPEKAKLSCLTMIMEIRSQLIKSSSDKKNSALISDEFVSGIGEADSLYSIISSIKELLCSISDSCFGKTTKSTMEKVVQYVRANYNRELRLEMLANIFGYNSAYLGKVFHQYTGENFNNYLDEIRISEAKRLLADEEYKVYEVAEMVGYTNINYFHNKFKKYVGVSPLSYKKNNGNI